MLPTSRAADSFVQFIFKEEEEEKEQQQQQQQDPEWEDVGIEFEALLNSSLENTRAVIDQRKSPDGKRVEASSSFFSPMARGKYATHL